MFQNLLAETGAIALFIVLKRNCAFIAGNRYFFISHQVDFIQPLIFSKFIYLLNKTIQYHCLQIVLIPDFVELLIAPVFYVVAIMSVRKNNRPFISIER